MASISNAISKPSTNKMQFPELTEEVSSSKTVFPESDRIDILSSSSVLASKPVVSVFIIITFLFLLIKKRQESHRKREKTVPLFESASLLNFSTKRGTNL